MRVKRKSAVFFSGLLLCGCLAGTALAEDAAARGEIAAVYRVDLGPLKLGEFKLNAAFNGSAYELQGNGRFKLLAGLLYKASGTTTSSGTLTKDGPQPAHFNVRYKAGKKKEQRELRFAAGAVREIAIDPHKEPGPQHVPVTEAQLEHVLDPMTAGFLSARSANGGLDVCERTVPVFDGRQRFDIVLSPKRTERMQTTPAGLSNPIAVCKVKYVPVSGHKPDGKGVKYMTKNKDMEVWLVRVADSAVYLPYHIRVPTAYGTGTATLIDIRMNLGREASAAGR